MKEEAFANLSVTGLLRKGEIYLLSEWGENHAQEPIKLLYVIRTEEELRQAVIMQFKIMHYACCEVRKFLRVQKINDDSYEFVSLLYEIDHDEEYERSIFLYRLMSFKEKRADIMDLYEDLEIPE